MNRTSLFIAAGGLFVVVAAGCQAIANLQTRTTDPLPTDACQLPSTGNGRVRLVDVASVGPGQTDPTNIANYTDFCIKPHGSGDWGRPLFRDGGIDSLCLGTSGQPGGMTYGEATVAFAVPVGAIDVKAVPSGQTCSATATSEVDNVSVGDSTAGHGVVTLMRWGGGTTTPEALVALPEDVATSLKPGTSYIRPINALSGGETLQFGISANSALPTTIATLIIPKIAPGGVAPPASDDTYGSVDPQGYQQILNLGLNYALGYADDAGDAGDTTNNAQVVFQAPADTQIGTLYVIGDPTDTLNQHSVRGMYCQDSAVVHADAGATTLASNVPAADQSLFQLCSFTQLPVLSIDVVNVSAYGANSPFQDQRLPVDEQAIAARTSDFMCIFETDDSSTRQAILNSVNPPPGSSTVQFPYYYVTTPETSEATPPTDPNQVKPALTTPPCAGSVSQTAVQNVFDCVNSNCSTTDDGGTTGILNGTTACLSTECFKAFAALYSAEQNSAQATDNDRCFDCIVYKLSSNEPIAQTQSECTTSTQQPFAFEGQTPSMFLSHYPIVAGSTKTYVFPATGYRRGILKAQVQLEDQKLDVFCQQLISPLIDQSIPYTGNYGKDQLLADGGFEDGWEDEQLLQANLALAWITSEVTADNVTGHVAAIIAGDFHSTSVPASIVDGGLANLAPEIISVFNNAPADAGLVPAVVPGQAPSCDYCPAPQNVYNAGTPPYELMHTFTIGFPKNATQTETLWGTDNNQVPITSLPNEPAPASGFGPLFEYYAHNYTFLRPTN